MISCDTSKLEAELKKFHEEAVRKLEGMVEIFSYKIAFQAIENTPFGDSDAYSSLYRNKIRLDLVHQDADAGRAKGGWVIQMNKPYTSWWFMKADSELASNVKWANDARSENYKIGDTVYITNNVPYVATDAWPYPTYRNGQPVMSLESGASQQAPQGIMQPTLNEIMGVNQLQLNQFYEAS